MWTIARIGEADYGCEERLPGEPLMLLITLESENGEVIQHLVPCYRKTDNAIGMYDVVNDEFHANEGTGEFLKGQNVND